MPRIKYSATQFSVSITAREAAMLARIAKSVEKHTYVKINRSEAVRCSIRAFDQMITEKLVSIEPEAGKQPEAEKVHRLDTAKNTWKELPGRLIKEQS